MSVTLETADSEVLLGTCRINSGTVILFQDVPIMRQFSGLTDNSTVN